MSRATSRLRPSFRPRSRSPPRRQHRSDRAPARVSFIATVHCSVCRPAFLFWFSEARLGRQSSIDTLERMKQKAVNTALGRVRYLIYAYSYEPRCRRPNARTDETVVTKPDRIVLDTCTVRALVHRTGAQLDLDSMKARKGAIRVSVADPAYAELLFALYEERIAWLDWHASIAALDLVLDTELPVLPGGVELAAMAGLKARPRLFSDTKRYQQTIWRLLADARSVGDLERGSEFSDSAGKRFRVHFDEATAKAALHESRTGWVDHIRLVQTLLGGQGVTQEEFVELIAVGLDSRGEKVEGVEASSERLNAMAAALGRFAFLSNAGKTPYDPESSGRRGDVFDFALLLALALPAVVVTLDGRFKKHLDLSKCTQARRLILVEEFNERLRAEALLELVA